MQSEADQVLVLVLVLVQELVQELVLEELEEDHQAARKHPAPHSRLVLQVVVSILTNLPATP